MKFVSLGLLSFGIILLMQVISPVISFQIFSIGQKANNQSLISPMSESGSILGVSVQNRNNFPLFISSLVRQTQANYDSFYLTIPKLKMERNNVYVDSNDLSQGLIHLPGSALPGEKGNMFISGHSAVNGFLAGQKAPFAKLTELKKNDEILVEAAENKFVYQVVEIKIVDPSDVAVISAPDLLGRYISLMTCVPPGLNFKRLVVIGKMI
ncbi:MAG: hypothetical protein ACD_38C00165G0003 [uncultured bacterium]|nr:MAG: hypothetical protein ACD_38C00165G0003 [uncultured bacterium]OGE20868.1 MAG: hypothetical protein A2778_06370 [Candidatus Daviesbacteria bacterium RIFCSPHIGHO2_01_FULL_40_24]OGE28220.1 MAG: hypothetical protein A3C29_04390 [Candidatus Daviesbacteria bacterium RIFCSPHIGHO2_02_FULL_40_16]OGE41841.1 MAG: hypothetical protein A3A53_05025 [Candidatus Daviesbacteria bacterium RIFCSPLOWO2_01_FULL_39_23]OGE66639.1 MAG: hypothetical protein A3J16_01125 [Candidatus Daviesbacteria bacterium RIFCSP